MRNRNRSAVRRFLPSLNRQPVPQKVAPAKIRRRGFLEALEPRMVLHGEFSPEFLPQGVENPIAGINPQGMLVVYTTTSAEYDNQIIVSQDGIGNVLITDVLVPFETTSIEGAELLDDQHTLKIPLASIPAQQLHLFGGGGDDTLTVDYANGDAILANGLFFYGGGQNSTDPGDQIILRNGDVDSVDYTFVNDNDGSIIIDGRRLEYTGLEPVTDNLSASTRSFTFTGAAETVVISDPTAGDGLTRINSTLGESVDFNVPTTSLTVITNGGDTVNINAFDSTFNTPLISLQGTTSTNNYNLGASNIIPDATALSLTGNVAFSLNGFNETVASLASTDATPTVNLTAGQTLTAGNATSTTYSGLLTGSGNLTKEGAGTLTLSGASTGYSGVTTINNGVLQLAAVDSVGTGNTVINTGATFEINNVTHNAPVALNNGGTLRGLGAAARENGVVTLAASGTVTLASASAASTLTLSDAANDLTGGAGGLTVNVTGAGVVALTQDSNAGVAANPVKWNVTSSILSFMGDLNFGVAPTAVTANLFTLTAGTLRNSATVAPTLATNRGITLAAGGGTIDNAVGSTNLTYSGRFTGANPLNVTGSITPAFIMNGPMAANQFSQLNINGTRVFFNNNVNALGGAASTTPINIITGQIGLISNAGGVFTVSNPITMASGTTIVSRATGANSLALTGVVTLPTTGTILFNTESTADGVINMTNAANAVALTGNLTIQVGPNTAGPGQVNFNHLFSGGFGLIKTQTGIAGLTNPANTYTGATQVNGGILEVATLAAAGLASPIGASTNAAANLQFSGGGLLRYTGGDFTIDRNYTVNAGGGGIDVSTAATTVTLSQTGTGAGGLFKAGAGTLLLTNAGSNFTGTSTVLQGTLRLGVTNGLPAGSGLIVGSGTTTGTFDMATFNQQLTTLGSATTTNAVANIITINPGRTLMTTAATTIGGLISGTNTSTALTMNGGGSFVTTGGVTFRVGGDGTGTTTGNSATLDMSGLATFVATVTTFAIGDNQGGTGNSANTVILATDSTITATTLDLNTGRASLQTLRLGAGLNVINADTINVGQVTQRASGLINFNSATGSVRIRDRAGTGRATFNVGAGTTGTDANITADVNFGGHVADILAGTLTIGQRTAAGAAQSGGTIVNFTFDSGTLDVNSIVLGPKTGTTAVNSIVSGTLNIGGGTVLVGTGGITMAQNAYSTGTGNTSAILNITGGTVTVNGAIVRGAAGTQTTTAVINQSGGLLDLTNHGIGGAALPIAYNKATAATAQLIGANSNFGVASFTAGNLFVNGFIGQLSTDAGTTLLPGNGPGAGAGLGVVIGNYVQNGALQLEITSPTGTVEGTHYDQIKVVGGTVTLGATATLNISYTGAPGSFNPGTGQVYTLIDNVSSTSSGTFAGLAEGATVTLDGKNLTLSYVGGDGNDVVLTSAGLPGPLYVNDQFTGSGTIDGDLEAPLMQSAVLGTTAFASITAALAMYPNYSGTIIVNGGTYTAAALAGGNGVTLRLVQDLSASEPDVTLQNLTGDANDTIVTRHYNGATGGNLIVTQGTFAGPILGIGNLTKTTTGTLTLSAANGYSGSTTITQGTITLGVNNALPTTTALTVGTGTTVGTLDMAAFNQTVGSLSSGSNSASLNTINVAAGKTLQVNGDVTLGNNTNNATTNLTMSGGGALVVNGANIRVGNNTAGTNIASKANWNLAALGSFTTTLSGALIIQAAGDNVANPSVLTLSDGVNIIKAPTITVGGSGSGGLQEIRLGGGTNVINATTINIGNGGRDPGSISFAGAAGSVVIRDLAGTGRAVFNMATTSGNTAAPAANAFNVAGHNADLLLGAVTIGTQNRGTSFSNTFAFDTGTLDMSSLVLGGRSGEASTGAGTARVNTTTMNLGGGNVTIGTGITNMGQISGTGYTATTQPHTVNATLNISGGNVTIGATSGNSIVMSAIAITGTTNVAALTANSVVNITGGVTTLAGNIVRPVVSGTTTGVITTTAGVNIAGGTLNMAVHSIGTATELISLPFTSGTIQGLSQYNGGAAVVKTGAGVGTIAGTNAYTGATTVSAGTLNVSGTIASAPTVQTGATLSGIGQTGLLTVNAGGIHAPGSTVGAMSVSGNYVQNGALNIELGGSGTFDQVKVIGSGSVTLGATSTLSVTYTGTPGTFAPVVGEQFMIVDNDGAVAGDTTGTFTGLAEGATVTVDGVNLTLQYHGGDGNDIVLVAATGTPVYYINNQFVSGTVDGDLEAPGTQTATVGVNAFASIAAALTFNPAFAGVMIVNGGTYTSALLAGGGNVTLRLVRDLANTEPDVVFQDLSGSAGDAIDMRYYDSTGGNLTVTQGTFAGVISGTGDFAKTTAGALTLSGANTYTGSTTINQGTVTLGVDNTLPVVTNLTIGTGTTTATLSLGTFNQTLASLTSASNSATANVITVGAGKTLNVTGGMTIGVANTSGAATQSKLTVNGGGAMTLTGTTVNISVNQAGTNVAWTNTGTFDVTALASFSATVSNFNLGVGGTSAGAGVVLLSNTANTIIANTLTVGDTGANNGSGTSTLTLGTGTNVLRVDNLTVGAGKGSGPGVLKFASQTAGSPGTVTVNNSAGTGPVTSIQIGDNSGTATAGAAVGTLDLRGHVSTINATAITLAQLNMTSNAGGTTGTLRFDSGVLTVDTLTIAPKTNAGTGKAVGLVDIGGGTMTVNSGIVLGSQSGLGGSTATLNITGGTVNLLGDLVNMGALTTSTLTLNGGTLNMNGNDIGGLIPVDVVNLQSGTLANVGQINSGANVSKTTAGTLTILGTNTYTGATTVSAGTLQLNGSLVSAPTVQTGATLTGAGTTGVLTVDVGGNLVPGSPIGLLAVTGNQVVNGALAMQIGSISGTAAGTDYDQIKVTNNGSVNIGAGATLTVTYTGTAGTFNPTVGSTYILIDNDGTAPGDTVGTFNGLPGGSTVTVDGKSLVIQYNGGDGNDVVLTVPAPTLLYVDDDFPVSGSVDGDLETAGTQSAVMGSTAFQSLAALLLANPTYSGAVIVNGGIYASALLAGGGNVTLRLVQDLTNNELNVQFNDLSGAAGDGIITRFNNVANANLIVTQGAFSGVISGGGTLSKINPTQVDLLGVNTYTGATTVTGGTLRVTGSIIPSATTVQTGATLTGAGTIGLLTVNAGGVHQPGVGTAVGLGNVQGNYVENGGLTVELSSATGTTAGTHYDQVRVTGSGSVALGATSTLTLTYTGAAGTFNPAVGSTYVIIDNDGAVAADTTGAFSGIPDGSFVIVDGKPLQINYHGGDGNDVVLVVPSITTLYVNDQFASGNVDGDLETAGTQTATVGVNAFATVAAALAAYPGFAGTIYVNGGTYPSALLAGGGNVTLRLLQDLTASELNVQFNDLSGDAGDAIVTRFNNVANANLTVTQGAFSGVISGNGGLTKTSATQVDLLGVNSYTGVTTVTGGTLKLTGSIIPSATTVQTGATLTGAGTMGLLTVNAGGVHQPGVGTAVGFGNVQGNYVENGGLTLEFGSINGTTAGTDFDQLRITGSGSVTLGGTSTLTVNYTGAPGTFNPTVGSIYRIIDNDGSAAADTTGNFAGLPEGATVTVDGKPMQIQYHAGDGNDVVLVALAPIAALYVDDDFPISGTVDGDLETAGTQPAVMGTSAFQSLAALFAANPSYAGVIVVNGGDYSATAASLAGGGDVVLRLVQDLTLGEVDVILGALSGSATDQIVTRFNNVANANLVVTSGSFPGVIGGSGGVIKNGVGTVTLSGANTFGGAAVVNGGVLSVGDVANSGSASHLGSGSGVTINGNSVLQFTGAAADSLNRTITLTGSAGAASPRIEVTSAAGDLQLTGAIAGAGQILGKLGAGALSLETGSTTNIGTFYAAGGVTNIRGSANVTAGQIGVGASPFFITGGGSGTLNIQGTATISTGTIHLGENNGGPTQTNFINQSGGTVTVTGNSGENAGIRLAHWGNETSTYTLSGGTLQLTDATADIAIATDGTGTFAQTGGILNVPGIMVDHRDANGSASFSLTGGTSTIGARGLRIADSTTSSIAGTANVTASSIAIGQFANSSLSIGGAAAVNVSGAVTLGTAAAIGGDLTITSTGVITFGALRVGRGTATITGANVTSTGVSTVGSNRSDEIPGMTTGSTAAGVLNIGSGSFTALGIVMGNADGGVVTGTINQSGGTVTTTGDATEGNGVRMGHWPQGTTFYNLSNGTLNVNGGFALSTATDGTGTFTQTGGVANVTQLDLNSRVAAAGNGTFTLNGGVFNVGSGGIVTDGGGGPYTANLGGGTLRATANWSSLLNFNLTNAVGAAIVDTNGFNVALSGVLSGAGALTKIGAGNLTLSGANVYGGATNANAGVLQLSGGAAVLDTAGAVNVGLGGTVQLLANETVSSYAGAGDLGAGTNDSTLALGAFTLTTTGNMALGNVTTSGGSLVSGGNIVDADDDNNITGAGMVLQAAAGVGTAVDPLETTLANLEASGGTGGVFVANTGNLVIGGVSALVGVSATASNVSVSASGSLTVNETVSTTGSGNVTLSTVDAAGAGQDIVLTAAVNVNSAGAIVLNAGDNATLAGSLLSGTTATVNVDAASADAGVGGVFSLTGTITAPGGAVINGNGDNDTFNLAPQAGAAVTVNGLAPDMTLVGDVLNLDLSATTSRQLTLGSIGAGVWTLNAPLKTVSYTSIEAMNSNTPFDLSLDANLAAFGNTGVPDLITVRQNGANLVVERTGSAAVPDNDDVGVIFQGASAQIQSFTYAGSADADVLTVSDVGGLPVFAGTAPSVPDNVNLAGVGSILFDGNGGADEIVFALTGASGGLSYAIGNGSGPGSGEGEVRAVSGAQTLQAYFVDVEQATRTGTNASPGTLNLIGDAAINAISIGATGATTTIGATGYTPLVFSGNNFNNISIDGGANADVLELASFGSGQTNNPTVTLSGGIGDDTLRVLSTSGNTGIVTLLGGVGSDSFVLQSAVGGPDEDITAPVIVDGTDGSIASNNDTLTIIDTADASGDTVFVNATSAGTSSDYRVEGVNAAAGDDVIFRNIDTLTYTGTTGNDAIDAQFTNTTPAHDLSIVTLNGWLGADQFLLFTSDQQGGTGPTPTATASGVATIALNGDAPGNPNALDGNDVFGATAPGLTGTGAGNAGLVVADSVRGIRPSASTAISINGGQPTAPVGTIGDSVGDVLNLDLSGVPTASSFVLATLSGVIASPGLQPLNYGQIEDLNFITNHQLLNLQLGDTLVRGTSGQDTIIFSKNPTPADPSGTRVRLNTLVVDFPMSGKTLTYAGDANDYVTHSNVTFPMEIHGEGGDDMLFGGMGNDLIYGGLGNDQVNASGGDNIVVGDEELIGTLPLVQDSTIGGNDVLSALGGNDVFYGGGGNDQVSPGAGNDYLHGGEGDDILDGAQGDDRIYGGGGNDVLSGSAGNDLVVGGEGNDLLLGAEGNDVLIGGGGADNLNGGGGDDLLITGRVANEASSWDSETATATFGAGLYSRPADNDAALLILLNAWSTTGDRSTLAAITSDAIFDQVWGYTGNDDFSTSAGEAQDFNANGMGLDELI